MVHINLLLHPLSETYRSQLCNLGFQMKFLMIIALVSLLHGCNELMPAFVSTFEDMHAETIGITVDKTVFNKKTDVKISVEITNQE